LLADVVVADTDPALLGPLAGLLAGLRGVRAPWWLVCPCDVSGLPPDVPPRLLRALRLNARAEVAVLRDATRLQPLVLALRGDLHAGIERYLDAGGRSVHGWLEQQRCTVVRMSGVLGNRNQSI
jgi:molybdopterin-guanine dinucleotide biosynthesis protein A